jgi:hypothetical protein
VRGLPGAPGPWPALPYEEWRDTLDTFHMVMQILGKVRVALSPPEPEWAHVALYVTARGIGTGMVPSPDGGIFEVEADIVDQRVVLRASTGDTRVVPLVARPVAEFYDEFVRALGKVGVDVTLSTNPQEVPDPIPFPDDTVHHTYDPDATHRFWQILARMVPPFAAWRAAFSGRVSPVHFFWGGMDLAITRFSGQPCTPPPGADLLLRKTYDAEQMSVGFWPGSSANYPEPAFYAYAYPRPDGYERAAVAPDAAWWNDPMGEFLLRYDDVRDSPNPGTLIVEFFDSVYTAVAEIRGWDPSLTAPR